MIATRLVVTRRVATSASSGAVLQAQGVRHPDSLCDGVAEAVSSAPCRALTAWLVAGTARLGVF